LKVLFSSNRNANFKTFTDYIEKAFIENGCHTVFFENRSFILPGRIRSRIDDLYKLDLKRLNMKLIGMAEKYRPAIFVEAGGWNILPDTIEALKAFGIRTALWTIDAPRVFEHIVNAAPHYDFVFTGGSEAYEILKKYNIKNLHWLPFACDSDLHKPIELTPEELKRYSTDVCFVGSWNPLYVKRRAVLEELTDFNVGIWGPGWDKLPAESPLRRFIRGLHAKPEDWTKIYSASKIVLCIHYHDTEGKVLCYQASPRVYEVLACGAFLVADRQKDILTLFNPGEHLVLFDNVKELREILTHYLSHPDEARTIAEKGRKKVLERHTYRHRIKEMLTTVQD